VQKIICTLQKFSINEVWKSYCVSSLLSSLLPANNASLTTTTRTRTVTWNRSDEIYIDSWERDMALTISVTCFPSGHFATSALPVATLASRISVLGFDEWVLKTIKISLFNNLTTGASENYLKQWIGSRNG